MTFKNKDTRYIVLYGQGYIFATFLELSYIYLWLLLSDVKPTHLSINTEETRWQEEDKRRWWSVLIF